MSNEAVNAIRDMSLGSPPAKFVLWILADRADKDMRCFPSIESIAKETNYAEKTVRRAIAELEEAGLVHVERTPGRGSTYTVTPVRVTAVRESPRSERPRSESPPTPVRESTHPGQSDRTPRSERPPNHQGTTTEPPVEPPPPAGAGGREVDDVAVGPLLLAIESSLMRGVLLNGKQVRGIVAAVNAAPAMLPRLVEAASEAESIRAPLAWVHSVIASGPTKGRRRQTSTSGIASDEAWAAMAAEHNAAKRRRAAP